VRLHRLPDHPGERLHALPPGRFCPVKAEFFAVDERISRCDKLKTPMTPTLFKTGPVLAPVSAD
jgi:hypothetical protein